MWQNESVNPLLTPGRIGAVELRNRIVMPPMTTRLSDEEGHVTDATIARPGSRSADPGAQSGAA